MSDRPSQPDSPTVLCPKCGTSNPRDVEECVYCGAAVPVPDGTLGEAEHIAVGATDAAIRKTTVLRLSVAVLRTAVLMLLYALGVYAVVVMPFLLIVPASAVCVLYESRAGARRRAGVTALLFAVGANATIAAANLQMLTIARGTSIRPMGLAMFDGLFPIAAGIAGAILALRAAFLDRGYWRLVSAAALALSAFPYSVGDYCFWAAVHAKGLLLEP